MSDNFSIPFQRVSGETKKVNVNQNVKITNYLPDDENGKGKLTVETKKAKDGHDYVSILLSGNDEKTHGQESHAKLSGYKYDVLMEIVGNDGILTEDDLKAANKNIKGVIDIVKKPEEGLATIFFKDGGLLRIDLETKTEKEARIAKEKAEAEAKKNKSQKSEEKSKSEPGILSKIYNFIVR